MAIAEEYNDNLHEEVHQLHNQLHPYNLPGAAEMDSEEEDEELEMEVAQSDDEEGKVSSMVSDHSE